MLSGRYTYMSLRDKPILIAVGSLFANTPGGGDRNNHRKLGMVRRTIYGGYEDLMSRALFMLPMHSNFIV